MTFIAIPVCQRVVQFRSSPFSFRFSLSLSLLFDFFDRSFLSFRRILKLFTTLIVRASPTDSCLF